MEKRIRRPLVFVLLAALLALTAYLFRDKLFQTDGRNPDVKDRPDLDNPEIKLPERFKWDQYVSKEPKLRLPVRILEEPRAAPLRIEADCAFLDGRLQPVIHVTYQTERARTELRVDATLLFQGFEQDRYTVVYPIKEKQRFLLSAKSALMADTATISVLGAAQFPVLTAYRIEQTATPEPPAQVPGIRPQKGGALQPAAARYNHHFQLGELANGTAYRVRVCELIDNVWVATEEAVTTTPFCPNDENLSRR
jgi:hypothetical protein